MMKALARLQITASLRRWPLMLIAALTLIGVMAAGGFEVSGVLRQDAALADILANFTRYSIVLPFVFAVLAFEVASAPRIVDMEEAAAACPDMRHQHWLAMMVPPALLLATVVVLYLAFKIAAIQLARQWSLLMPNILAHTMLDIVVPCTIGMLLGVLAARHLGRYAGYAAIVLFAFLVGPYSEVVPALAQMNVTKGGGGVNLYPVYDVFRVLAPDPTWGMDSLYGFPVEYERWMVAGFWILGLFAALIPTIMSPRVRGTRYLRAALALLTLVCLVAALLPSSELRRDYRFLGGSSTLSNQGYYQMQIGDHPQREMPAGFQVNRYEMDFEAGRQLNATVSMDIATHPSVDTYRFTLYHGYRIARVLGSRGEPLNYVQDGDYVTVASATEQSRLTFDYSGSGDIYIANYQCVYLPGYFAYYPVPGFVRTYDYVDNAVISSVDNRRPVDFSVRFDSWMPLASSLEERNGRFQGRAVSPSFVGGLLSQDVIDGHRVVSFPAGGGDPGRTESMITRLREYERRVGVSMSESAVNADTKIIQMPGFTQGNGAVALPDSVFVGGFDEAFAAQILLARTPARMDRTNLREALAVFLADPRGITGTNDRVPTRAEILSLEEARITASDDVQRVLGYVYPAKSVVFRLFQEKMRVSGEDAVIRDTYRYLASDSVMSELEYLTQSSDGEPQ